MELRIGIDFGGVIVRAGRSPRADTRLDSNDGDEIAHDGVFTAIRDCVVVSDGAVRIVRLISEGGMGRVYEGVRENPHRTIAIKVVKERLATRLPPRHHADGSSLLSPPQQKLWVKSCSVSRPRT